MAKSPTYPMTEEEKQHCALLRGVVFDRMYRDHRIGATLLRRLALPNPVVTEGQRRQMYFLLYRYRGELHFQGTRGEKHTFARLVEKRMLRKKVDPERTKKYKEKYLQRKAQGLVDPNETRGNFSKRHNPLEVLSRMMATSEGNGQ